MINRIGDTIVAISTPKGIGGIGIVRVSGSLSYYIASCILKKKPKLRVADCCTFWDNKYIIDIGLYLYFKCPFSFTGEDVLELHAHGSNIILNSLVKRSLELGARLAEPGEFTFRSFFNNKIDLIQAESINNLIHSKSVYFNKMILNSLSGVLSGKIKNFINKLIKIRTSIEAYIDFVDYDRLISKNLIYDLIELINDFILFFKKVYINNNLSSEIKIVILGKSNVGKSSLFNLLLKENRSIISDISGTTRDFIVGNFVLDNCYFNLVDTAGLNNFSNDILEREGIVRSLDQVIKSDVVIFMSDINDKEIVNNDKFFIKLLSVCKNKLKFFHIKNKIDKKNLPSRIFHNDMFTEVHISVITLQGFHLFIKDLLGLFDNSYKDVHMVSNRHYNLLVDAYNLFIKCQCDINEGTSIEVIAEHLKFIHQVLSDIIGVNASKELFLNIFSSFCIGK